MSLGLGSASCTFQLRPAAGSGIDAFCWYSKKAAAVSICTPKRARDSSWHREAISQSRFWSLDAENVVATAPKYSGVQQLQRHGVVGRSVGRVADPEAGADTANHS